MKKVTVIETLVDDLDGSEATHTIPFAIDGTAYEVDLSDYNAERLRKMLDEFTSAARVTRKGKAKVTAKGGKEPSAKEVREWALANGVEVSVTGRVNKEAVDAYKAAH